MRNSQSSMQAAPRSEANAEEEVRVFENVFINIIIIKQELAEDELKAKSTCLMSKEKYETIIKVIKDCNSADEQSKK